MSLMTHSLLRLRFSPILSSHPTSQSPRPITRTNTRNHAVVFDTHLDETTRIYRTAGPQDFHKVLLTECRVAVPFRNGANRTEVRGKSCVSVSPSPSPSAPQFSNRIRRAVSPTTAVGRMNRRYGSIGTAKLPLHTYQHSTFNIILSFCRVSIKSRHGCPALSLGRV
jgi:hypothetical protein